MYDYNVVDKALKRLLIVTTILCFLFVVAVFLTQN